MARALQSDLAHLESVAQDLDRQLGPKTPCLDLSLQLNGCSVAVSRSIKLGRLVLKADDVVYASGRAALILACLKAT